MAEQTGVTFEELATEAEQKKVAEVVQVVDTTVAAAQSIEVRTHEEVQRATEFLAQIARAKKDAEKARRFLVDPLNKHVKAINAEFKVKTEPLDEADQVVRGKVLAYNAEQERLRAEEQARLDAEAEQRRQEAEEQRRKEEAEAQAAREQAAREAAAAEAEARKAEEERQRQIAAEGSALAQRAAGAPDEALRAAAERQDAFGHAARTELASRQAAREAQERAAAAAAREEEARAAEEATKARPLPDIPVAQVAAPTGPVHTASGSASTTRRWVGEVVDEAKVPRDYLVVDQKAINAAVKAGVRSIPGVDIKQVDGLAVRAA